MTWTGQIRGFITFMIRAPPTEAPPEDTMIETVETKTGRKEHIIVDETRSAMGIKVTTACGHKHFKRENGTHEYGSTAEIPSGQLCNNCLERWILVYSNVN